MLFPRSFVLGLLLFSGLEAQEVKLYGNIEVDITQDNRANDLGFEQNSVLSNRTSDISARASRLGARFKGAQLMDAQISGKIEGDFNGASLSEGNSAFRMRHGFVRMDWDRSKTYLLVGQTTDLISPLLMDTISYPVESFTGDLGNRRPQIQAGKRFDLGQSSFQIQGSLSKTTGTFTNVPPGAQLPVLNIPIFMARMSLDANLGEIVGSYGIWGHLGAKRYQFDPHMEAEQIKVWSQGLDAMMKMPGGFVLMLEIWKGVMMDLYRMGLEHVNYQQRRAVESRGGWMTLTYRPTKTWRFNAGAGLDNPVSEDLSYQSKVRTKTFVLNSFYNLEERWEVGLELSHWTSKTLGVSDQTDKTRVQMSLSYFF